MMPALAFGGLATFDFFKSQVNNKVFLKIKEEMSQYPNQNITLIKS